MCSEDIFIAGRYNKYVRNLSQSPWIDKTDTRVKDSVQELIEEGLKKFLQFDKAVFSSSGREDVDVRMLGKGRPFAFRIVNPWNIDSYDENAMRKIQLYINSRQVDKIRVIDLQTVSKEDVGKHLKDGQESKTKEYRALCCVSRALSFDEIEKISKTVELCIEQKTPIRVLHRRSLAPRRRMIHKLRIEPASQDDFNFRVPTEDREKVFVLHLLTEAGTYIKEFVHGDFGRTKPSLATLLSNCDTDLIELDVMVSIYNSSFHNNYQSIKLTISYLRRSIWTGLLQ